MHMFCIFTGVCVYVSKVSHMRVRVKVKITTATVVPTSLSVPGAGLHFETEKVRPRESPVHEHGAGTRLRSPTGYGSGVSRRLHTSRTQDVRVGQSGLACRLGWRMGMRLRVQVIIRVKTRA